MKTLELEVHAWKKKSMEYEAIVLDLNKKINPMRESNSGEDSESICEGDHEENEIKFVVSCVTW